MSSRNNTSATATRNYGVVQLWRQPTWSQVIRHQAALRYSLDTTSEASASSPSQLRKRMRPKCSTPRYLPTANRWAHLNMHAVSCMFEKYCRKESQGYNDHSFRPLRRKTRRRRKSFSCRGGSSTSATAWRSAPVVSPSG